MYKLFVLFILLCLVIRIYETRYTGNLYISECWGGTEHSDITRFHCTSFGLKLELLGFDASGVKLNGPELPWSSDMSFLILNDPTSVSNLRSCVTFFLSNSINRSSRTWHRIRLF
jgi:hypothetical protein